MSDADVCDTTAKRVVAVMPSKKREIFPIQAHYVFRKAYLKQMLCFSSTHERSRSKQQERGLSYKGKSTTG